MNLFMRFFFQVIRSYFSKKIGFNDVDSVNMRVWPQDLDLNFHLNNGVFLSIMDMGRTRYVIRSGFAKAAIKYGWGLGVVGGVNITYLRSLALFQKFTLRTKFAGHCNGWYYIEQRYESRGKLVAAALIKVTFLRKSKRVEADEVIEKMGVDSIGENLDYLEELFQSEQKFLSKVKEDYS
jgi:acyl-CoA thioesterase FadM